jgi:hypothetical protein
MNAEPAPRDRFDGDAGSHAQAFDSGSDGGDFTAGFVADDQRAADRAVSSCVDAIVHQEIRAAEARSPDPNQCFASCGLGSRPVHRGHVSVSRRCFHEGAHACSRLTIETDPAASQPANLYYRQNKYTLGNISIGWEQIEP